MIKKIAVIPAYNEEQTIGDIIKETKKYVDEVLVVNDGSRDRTGEIAKNYGAKIINLSLNRGLGSALRTGLAAAVLRYADIVVTLDADGQHNPKDIEKIISPISNKEADVVIGTRMKNTEGMPIIRKLANWIGNLFTFFLFGILVTDSQSGFRAFSSFAIKKIGLESDRMEVSSEIIKEIKKNSLRLKEVSIQPIYTKYSLSKGQGFFVGIETAFKLFLRKLNK